MIEIHACTHRQSHTLTLGRTHSITQACANTHTYMYFYPIYDLSVVLVCLLLLITSRLVLYIFDNFPWKVKVNVILDKMWTLGSKYLRGLTTLYSGKSYLSLLCRCFLSLTESRYRTITNDILIFSVNLLHPPLRKRRYCFSVMFVSLLVYLFADNIAQELLGGFGWNL